MKKLVLLLLFLTCHLYAEPRFNVKLESITVGANENHCADIVVTVYCTRYEDEELKVSKTNLATPEHELCPNGMYRSDGSAGDSFIWDIGNTCKAGERGHLVILRSGTAFDSKSSDEILKSLNGKDEVDIQFDGNLRNACFLRSESSRMIKRDIQATIRIEKL